MYGDLAVGFGFIGFFGFDPYLGVVFCMAVVAASTTGDTYSGILLGIPGANSAAATMVDGHPLAQQGKATYALTSAITTSTINGLLWGTLTFALLPWYAKLIMYFGIPELWAFVMLSLACVGFVSNKFWFSFVHVDYRMGRSGCRTWNGTTTGIPITNHSLGTFFKRVNKFQ